MQNKLICFKIDLVMAYMKKVFNLKILVVLIFIFSALSGILFTACSGNDAKEPENGVSEQADKRIFSFAEHVGTISNPGMGYTTTDWYHTAVGATPVRDKQGDIVLFFIVSNSTQVKVFQVVLQLNARILEVLIGHHLMLLD